MKRRYCLTFLAVLGLVWAGWRSMAGAQQSPADSAEPPGIQDLPVATPLMPLSPIPVAGTPASAKGAAAPVCRDEPALRIEWIGPPAVRVGMPSDYTLAIRNVSTGPVNAAAARVVIAPGVNVVATEPPATLIDGALTWELGSIAPRQERHFQVRLAPTTKGDFDAHASVTFSGGVAMKIRASEPKLELRAASPGKVQLGDGAAFVLSATNPGDGVAERVRMAAVLSDGLEHARGRHVEFDLGNLNPGETRVVQVLCVARAGGEQTCQAAVEAEGLRADGAAALTVVSPRLELEVRGPNLRYLDRKATYAIKVTNPSDASAANVTVADAIPAGFKFLAADHGGRFDPASRSISWFVGDLAAKESREVACELQAINTGEFTHKVAARGARGLKADGEYAVRVDGLSAILLECVDREDPVEVGGETTYEVKITNTGTKTETDLRLTCSLSGKTQLQGATGPTGHMFKDGELTFAPLAQLAPRSEAVYRVTVKAAGAGVAYFKSQVTSTLLVEPVQKVEATRIYTD